MKRVLISDWFEKFGGAEKVVQAICEVYKFDHYFAYIDLMPESTKIKVFGKNIIVYQSNVLKKFGKKFRFLMPFFPIIVKQFNSDTSKKYSSNLIISSSWILSKGFKLDGALHICYLQARNFKYVWDESHLYFKGVFKLFSFIKVYLQKFDIQSAQNPDFLISNSIFVQQWTKRKYHRDSVVIYPPVDVEDFYITDTMEDYYITVGRLEPYKRFDVVIDAFTKNNKKLIVIGDGSEMKYLKSKSGPNIVFLGFSDKNVIKDYLSKAKAFVYAGVEDFGIVLVEAHASGIPTLVYNGGAANEIVTEENGVFYNEQNSESLNKSIEIFEKNYNMFCKNKIRETSLKYSKERFKLEFKQFVDSKIKS